MKKSFLPQLIFLAAILCATHHVKAQMVDCDVFLQGNHLELGINSNGAFGTNHQAPVGYHANVSDTLFDACGTFSSEHYQDLGFVVDPNNTGWTSYYGDYIMPGNPREGWAISDSAGLGTATAYSYNWYTSTAGFTGPLMGANTGWTSGGGVIKGYWSGTYSSTLNINQIVTIDTGNLFLLIHVGFYNTGTTPIDSFYYVRTINPHNEAVLTSNLSTRNKIEHQLPNPDGLVVVSATGLTDTNNYLALGTMDPRAKCFITRDSTLPGPGTFASIWAGDTANYNYSDTMTANQSIGIIYKISVGAGDSLFLDFGYAFKPGIIDTVLDTSLIDSGGGGGGGILKTPALTNVQHITAYPNPATDMLNITGLASGDLVLVYDILGRLVAEDSQPILKGVNTISTGNLPAGIYILIVRDSNGNALARIPVSKK